MKSSLAGDYLVFGIELSYKDRGDETMEFNGFCKLGKFFLINGLPRLDRIGPDLVKRELHHL
jgi:hypothetical protein